ncbi:unnamed protein product [Schistosoma mattheei]|uniref:Uncharacterized protein n=1 Tax=Schistosoma mattheei TaxID=31246 RepID=A0A183Q719_9TREM|nr:unnamed protein product [Schistosoma mattheei]
MTASTTKTRYQRMTLTLLLAICFVEAVFGLDAQEAQLMLQVHNEHREYRSKCGETDIVPAEELLQPLEWDDELAAAAQMWSENCDVHDKKATGKVGKFASVGQNIAVQSELAGAVTYWMKESDHYDHKSDHCEPQHQCDSYKQVCEYINYVIEQNLKLHYQSLDEISSLRFSQIHLDSSIRHELRRMWLYQVSRL